MSKLWILSGNYWSLPISVEFSGDMAGVRVGCGIRLLDNQIAEANARIKALKAYRHNNRWWLPKGILEKSAQPAPEGTNPEDVVEWMPRHRRVNYRKPGDPEQENIDEFFHEFAKLGWVKSAQQAEILWHAFMRHVQHWFVNVCKPVDFVFFEVAPLPFRPNWQCWVQAALEKTNPTKQAEYMKTYAMGDQLRMWSQSSKTFLWGLSIFPKKNWWQTSIRSERNRWIGLKRDMDKYCQRHSGLIQALMPVIVKHYEHYLSQIQRPYLWASKERPPLRHISTEVAKKRGTPQVARQTPPISAAVLRRTRKTADGIPVDSLPTDGALPKLRNL